jgi:hypothetical protein
MAHEMANLESLVGDKGHFSGSGIMTNPQPTNQLTNPSQNFEEEQP